MVNASKRQQISKGEVSMHQQRWFTACAALAILLLTTGSVAHAQSQDSQDQGQNRPGDGQGYKTPAPAATPELDAGVLYAIGLAGTVGTVLYVRRRRAKATRSE
jgi:hypothetical protein